ncbi:hypothetical protein JA1_004958 [Spathaspora sp. JA1]|nr:hypothetical protein JA1_004958 [Spathaspora sp. JA1]
MKVSEPEISTVATLDNEATVEISQEDTISEIEPSQSSPTTTVPPATFVTTLGFSGYGENRNCPKTWKDNCIADPVPTYEMQPYMEKVEFVKIGLIREDLYEVLVEIEVNPAGRSASSIDYIKFRTETPWNYLPIPLIIYNSSVEDNILGDSPYHFFLRWDMQPDHINDLTCTKFFSIDFFWKDGTYESVDDMVPIQHLYFFHGCMVGAPNHFPSQCWYEHCVPLTPSQPDPIPIQPSEPDPPPAVENPGPAPEAPPSAPSPPLDDEAAESSTGEGDETTVTEEETSEFEVNETHDEIASSSQSENTAEGTVAPQTEASTVESSSNEPTLETSLDRPVSDEPSRSHSPTTTAPPATLETTLDFGGHGENRNCPKTWKDNCIADPVPTYEMQPYMEKVEFVKIGLIREDLYEVLVEIQVNPAGRSASSIDYIKFRTETPWNYLPTPLIIYNSSVEDNILGDSPYHFFLRWDMQPDHINELTCTKFFSITFLWKDGTYESVDDMVPIQNLYVFHGCTVGAPNHFPSQCWYEQCEPIQPLEPDPLPGQSQPDPPPAVENPGPAPEDPPPTVENPGPGPEDPPSLSESSPVESASVGLETDFTEPDQSQIQTLEVSEPAEDGNSTSPEEEEYSYEPTITTAVPTFSTSNTLLPTPNTICTRSWENKCNVSTDGTNGYTRAMKKFEFTEINIISENYYEVLVEVEIDPYVFPVSYPEYISLNDLVTPDDYLPSPFVIYNAFSEDNALRESPYHFFIKWAMETQNVAGLVCTTPFSIEYSLRLATAPAPGNPGRPYERASSNLLVSFIHNCESENPHDYPLQCWKETCLGGIDPTQSDSEEIPSDPTTSYTDPPKGTGVAQPPPPPPVFTPPSQAGPEDPPPPPVFTPPSQAGPEDPNPVVDPTYIFTIGPLPPLPTEPEESDYPIPSTESMEEYTTTGVGESGWEPQVTTSVIDQSADEPIDQSTTYKEEEITGHATTEVEDESISDSEDGTTANTQEETTTSPEEESFATHDESTTEEQTESVTEVVEESTSLPEDELSTVVSTTENVVEASNEVQDVTTSEDETESIADPHDYTTIAMEDETTLATEDEFTTSAEITTEPNSQTQTEPHAEASTDLESTFDPNVPATDPEEPKTSEEPNAPVLELPKSKELTTEDTTIPSIVPVTETTIGPETELPLEISDNPTNEDLSTTIAESSVQYTPQITRTATVTVTNVDDSTTRVFTETVTYTAANPPVETQIFTETIASTYADPTTTRTFIETVTYTTVDLPPGPRTLTDTVTTVVGDPGNPANSITLTLTLTTTIPSPNPSGTSTVITITNPDTTYVTTIAESYIPPVVVTTISNPDTTYVTTITQSYNPPVLVTISGPDTTYVTVITEPYNTPVVTTILGADTTYVTTTISYPSGFPSSPTGSRQGGPSDPNEPVNSNDPNVLNPTVPNSPSVPNISSGNPDQNEPRPLPYSGGDPNSQVNTGTLTGNPEPEEELQIPYSGSYQDLPPNNSNPEINTSPKSESSPNDPADKQDQEEQLEVPYSGEYPNAPANINNPNAIANPVDSNAPNPEYQDPSVNLGDPGQEEQLQVPSSGYNPNNPLDPNEPPANPNGSSEELLQSPNELIYTSTVATTVVSDGITYETSVPVVYTTTVSNGIPEIIIASATPFSGSTDPNPDLEEFLEDYTGSASGLISDAFLLCLCLISSMMFV